jgi:hypothetical protein
VSDFISNQTAEIDRQFKVFSRLTDQRITDLRRETEEKLEELHDAADLLYEQHERMKKELKWTREVAFILFMCLGLALLLSLFL